MKRLFGVLLLAGAVLAVADDKKMTRPSRVEEDGRNLAVRLGGNNGQMMPADMAKTIKSVIKGDKLSIHFGDTMVFEGTMSVDPTKKPKSMDTVSKDKKMTGLAIYELDGDTFKICVGNKGERPKEFTGKKDSGWCVIRLQTREEIIWTHADSRSATSG